MSFPKRESEGFATAPKKSFPRKYFYLRTFAQTCWEPERSSHPHFAIKERLISPDLRNPRPPTGLDLQIALKERRHILWLPLAVISHQHLRNVPSSLLQMNLGSTLVAMLYEGDAWATVLIKIIRPALEKSFCFQQATLNSVCSTRKLQSLVLFLPINNGSPRWRRLSLIWL